MARVLKREAARRDLVAQWAWYAENASIEVADRFLKAVEETLKLLAMQPGIGKAVQVRKAELEGVRWFRVSKEFEKILLFYSPLQNGIDLIRVIHGNRDLERLLTGHQLG